MGASHHTLFLALFFARASFRPFLTTLQKGQKEACRASFCPFPVALFLALFTLTLTLTISESDKPRAISESDWPLALRRLVTIRVHHIWINAISGR